jgi:hypothetical protein
VFCLLPSKCSEVNEYIVENIKRLCSNLNFEFSPVEIYSDFEKSILNSASNILPEIKLSTYRSTDLTWGNVGSENFKVLD